jgi:hypothetical protein
MKRTNIIKGELCANTFYIIILLISLFLTYNELLESEDKQCYLEKSQIKKVNLFDKTAILIIVIFFLYDTYINYKDIRKTKNNLKNEKLQLFASSLTVISCLIVLYVCYDDCKNTINIGINNEL